MPYKFEEVGTEPKPLLLRRGQVLNWIGITKNAFDKIVASGLLDWQVFLEDGVRYYKKEDVKRVFLENFRTGKG